MHKELKEIISESLKNRKMVEGYDNPTEVLLTEKASDKLKKECKGHKIYLIESKPLIINVSGTYKTFNVDSEEIVFESKGSYQDAFKSAMKKFGINKIGNLKDNQKKKEFFDYVDRIWTSDEEKGIKSEKAVSRAQQAAIAISKKERGENPKKEVAPPGRKDQVKKLKKIKPKTKDGKELNPFAIAWSQHNKHGRPDS